MKRSHKQSDKHKTSIANLSLLLRPGFIILLGIGLWAGVVSCASSPAPEPPSRVVEDISQIQEQKQPAISKIIQTPTTQTPPAAQYWIQNQLDGMSLSSKLGQFLVVGISGKVFTKELDKQLTNLKPGGIILFSRNIQSFQQLRTLTEQLQAHAQRNKIPPYFIMLDQEGGSVTRVKIGTPLPSALALSKTNSPEFVRSYSNTMGELLNRLGINMNLAPVLDVSDPKSASFIGSRSFGKSNESVAKLGLAFAQGQWDAGVIPTAKHFPGHGGLNQDSHKVTPVKNISIEELISGEGFPFSQYAKLDFPTAIMLGHVSYPLIDQTRFPAAFSKEVATALLRERMEYKGLALTDDLEMAGAEMVGNMAQRTVQAFKAGNDMIMVAWSTNRQVSALKALEDGANRKEISEGRIQQSLIRILEAKFLALQKRSAYSMDSVTQLQRRLGQQSNEIKKLSFQSALSDPTSAIAFENSKDPIQIISSDEGFYRFFKKSFHGPSRFVKVTKGNIAKTIRSLNGHPSTQPFIFYVSGLGTARWLERLTLENKQQAIVINTNQPGAIKSAEDFLRVVHINSQSPESGGWLAHYLNVQATRDDGRIPAGN